jgi:hypothetical protein
VTSINHGGGAVQFSCDGLPTGAGCDLAPNIAGNTAENFSINTNNLPIGDYPFTVLGAVGSITHTANATLHVGDFGTATITPASTTLGVGQSATFNLTVSSVNGFNDTVNLACSTSVNGHATSGVGCSFLPSPATFDASGKLTAQMTVTISAVPRSGNVPVQAATAPRWLVPLATFVLVGAVLMAAPKRRRGVVTLCGICLLGIVSITACGGGGGNGGGGVGTTPTPTPTPSPTPQSAVVKIDVLGSSTVQTGQTAKTLASVNVTVQ